MSWPYFSHVFRNSSSPYPPTSPDWPLHQQTCGKTILEKVKLNSRVLAVTRELMVLCVWFTGKNYKKTPRYYIDQKSEAFSQAVPTTQESAQANENQLFIKEVSFPRCKPYVSYSQKKQMEWNWIDNWPFLNDIADNSPLDLGGGD